MTITYTHKRISKKSKTLTASLLLYGLHESSFIDKNNSEFYSVFNFIESSGLKIIEIKINKHKAEYRIRSNIDEVRTKSKPITKNTLSDILRELNCDNTN